MERNLSFLQIVLLIDLILTLTTTVIYLANPQSSFFDSLGVNWTDGVKAPDARNLVALLFYAFQGRNLLVGWTLFVALISEKRARWFIACGIAVWCVYAAVVFSMTGFAHLAATRMAVIGLTVFGGLYALGIAMEYRTMRNKGRKFW